MWEDILGFENAEFYIKRWPELDGMRFADVLLSFPDAIPCGVKVAARKGKIVLNPDDDYVLAEGDEVLVVADDDDSYAPSTSLPEVPLSCFFGLCCYWCCCCRFLKCTNQSVGVLLLLLFSFETAMGLNVLENVHTGQLELHAFFGVFCYWGLVAFFFQITCQICWHFVVVALPARCYTP